MPSDRRSVLTRDEVERVYRLRPLQQGMLFHELETAGPSPYFRQVVFALDGTVDPARCEAAWNRVLARHPLLRSQFDFRRTDDPVQIVLTRSLVDFAWAEAPDHDTVAAWCAADRDRGFDLAADPLMRVRLFRRGPDRWDMVWSHPHILLDGWSGALVLEEFAAHYAGRAADLPPPGDPEPWLRALARRDERAARAYWAGLLAGYQGGCALPVLGPGGTADPAEHSVLFDHDDGAALDILARRGGVTLAVLVQALWAVCLGRWCDGDDIVFGTVVSGRTVEAPGIERLAGLVINTVPVRALLRADEPFAGLLTRLQAQAVGSLAHDHLGLAAIREAAALPAEPVDHLVVVENYPQGQGDRWSTGFRVRSVEARDGSNYGFGLMVRPGERLELVLMHDRTRHPPAQIAALDAGLRRLVAQVLADPRTPVGALDAGAQPVLAGPPVVADPTETIHARWAAQVARRPEAPALTDGARTLSYGDVDRLAEALAAALAGQEHAVIGVLAGRGAARIVALLAILKAGAAYLPLSPALPDARLAQMIGDAACRLVLTDDPGRVERAAPVATLPLAATPAGRPATVAAAAGTLAYVIYTSGSTGRPKGVAVGHGSFLAMIDAQIAGFGVTPDDRVLQFASCAFDASLSEIFMALLAGACLVLARPAAIRDGAALVDQIRADRVTVATLPPAYLRALDGAGLEPLRVLITAGEAADPRDAVHYAGRLRYFNAYGPTEASVCATWHEVVAGAGYPQGVPIGRPIAGTLAAIRDRQGRPVPPGAPGELWLGGAGLARGYLGPAGDGGFLHRDGARWYRTGDRVRVADGEIHYLGRLDSQVKLRGFRVEPGEVEAVLAGHPAVAQTAVVVRDGGLLAFAVADAEPAALRAWLAQRLPPWMVPGTVHLIDRLPRTLAGKIDRHALARIAALPSQAPVPRPLDPPLGPVAEAFAAVFGPGPWHGGTSFRDAGGDSLKAIRLLGRLRRAGLTLDLAGLLAADTIAAIAAAAGLSNGSAPADPDAGPLPPTPILAWFLHGHSRGHDQLTHLVLVACDRPVETTALAAALDHLVRRHDALRLAATRKAEGGWVLEVRPPGPAFEVAACDLRGASDPWAELRTFATAFQDGFDLASGALFRAARCRLDLGDYILLAAHHLGVDAWSWHILLDDLFALLAGQALPPTTAAYRQWAASLDAWARDGAEAERPYWTAIAAAETAPLPADGASRPHGYGDTALITTDLGPTLDEPRRRTVARLLTALARTICGRDGQRPIRVMLAGHGRHPPFPGVDVSRTVGWFTADYPVLVHPGPVAETEAMLAAVPSGGLGWGALAWGSAVPLATPRVELAFNDLGRTDPALAPGFRLADGLPAAVIGTMERRSAIEIEAEVRAGRVSLAWRYHPQHHHPAPMANLAAGLADAYRSILREDGP